MRSAYLFSLLRRIVQLFSLFLFIFFLRKFLYFDPLLNLSLFFSTHTLPRLFFISLFIIFFTIFLGRFFCGWFCPLGTLNHFFSFIFKKIFFKKRIEIYHPAQKIKYFFFIILLILAILRINLTGLFSPLLIIHNGFSFIRRIFFPLFDFLNKYFYIFANDRIFYWFQENIEYLPIQTGRSIYTIGLCLIILGFNLFATRFWCRFLCPLGGFLGFISQKGILNISQLESCQNCFKCIKNCQGTCNPHLKDRWIKQECIFCMNCLSCPKNKLKFIPQIDKNKLKYEKINFTRRQFLLNLGGVLVIYPLVKLNLRRSPNKLIRPPGALTEKVFLNQCIRCQSCIKNCPTQFLQPSLFELNIFNLFTPYGDGKTGYCKYECNLCGEICPTGAIRKMDLSEKQKFKIGSAFIEKAKCLVYAQKTNCLKCFINCPLRKKAIIYIEVEESLYGPEIIPEECLGCALCEYTCPTKAIRVIGV